MNSNSTPLTVLNTSISDAEYGPLSTDFYNILGTYLTVISVVSFLSNGLIIYVFLSLRLWKNQVNVFIINLAVSNTIESSLGYPLAVVSSFYKRWVFGDLGCQLYGVICFVSSLTSMCTFCVIGICRYIVICHPEVTLLRHRKTTTMIISIVWTYSTFWALLPFIGWGKYGQEPFKTSCSLAWTDKTESNKSYILSVFIFIFFIPVSIILNMYSKITKKIRGQVMDGGRNNNETGNNNRLDHVQNMATIQRVDTRAEKIILISITAFLVAWIPYASMSFLSAIGVEFPVTVTPIPTFFAKTQCAVNPLIFAFGYEDFRRKLKLMFCGR